MTRAQAQKHRETALAWLRHHALDAFNKGRLVPQRWYAVNCDAFPGHSLADAFNYTHHSVKECWASWAKALTNQYGSGQAFHVRDCGDLRTYPPRGHNMHGKQHTFFFYTCMCVRAQSTVCPA